MTDRTFAAVGVGVWMNLTCSIPWDLSAESLNHVRASAATRYWRNPSPTYRTLEIIILIEPDIILEVLDHTAAGIPTCACLPFPIVSYYSIADHTLSSHPVTADILHAAMLK